MNVRLFVLGLLGKEFMRMAKSISTKFMTWARISAAPCFAIPVCFLFGCEAEKVNGSGRVEESLLLQSTKNEGEMQKTGVFLADKSGKT